MFKLWLQLFLHGKSEVLILCEVNFVNYFGKCSLEVRFYSPLVLCFQFCLKFMIHENMREKWKIFMRRAVWNEQTCHIFQNLRQISIFFTFTKYLVTVLIFKSVTAVRVLLQSIPMKLIAVLYQRTLKSENCSRRVLPFPSC